jgi:proline iminopeptidase
MRVALSAFLAALCVSPAGASPDGPETRITPAPREHRIPVGRVQLYAREVGGGPPIIVLHGGPDFDHRYLLPDMDRLSDAFRLIYYDQRGRGLSADGVRPEEVSLASDIEDLDTVRRHFGLPSATLLGHSWGALLALEYALRHPNRVSCLILMNPAPASSDDFTMLRKARIERLGADLGRLKAAAVTPAYREGDPDAVAAYYRIHFKPALRRPEDLEKVIVSLRASFTRDGILKARAIEERLMQDTWLSSGYDLLPKLATLNARTLVIYTDHDFIPAPAADHIARALPNGHLVTLRDCGHFSYLECPDAVRAQLDSFFHRTPPGRPPRGPAK